MHVYINFNIVLILLLLFLFSLLIFFMKFNMCVVYLHTIIGGNKEILSYLSPIFSANEMN
jgi:hypothetical protein